MLPVEGTPFVCLCVPDSRTKQKLKIETLCCLCWVFLEYKLVHFLASLCMFLFFSVTKVKRTKVKVTNCSDKKFIVQ